MSTFTGLFRLSRLRTFGRVLVSLEFAVAVGAIVCVGFQLYGDVFIGSPAALAVRIDGSCEGVVPTSSCEVSITTLNAGRYRIATDVPTTRLVLGLSPRPAVERAHSLLIRLSQPKALRLEMRNGPTVAQPVAQVHLTEADVRTVTALPPLPSVVTALSFVPEADAAPGPLVLDEVGFFEESRGLLSDVRPMFSMIPTRLYYGFLVPRTVVALCAFSVIAAFAVPGQMLKKLNPALLGLVCLALCLLELAILYSPYWSRDLRLFYASGPLLEPPGSNLKTGLWQGSRLLQGQGLTFTTGLVPWERMPGYGLFCALAGALFGQSTLVDMAIAAVLLQVLFYAAALSVFAWAAGLLWPPQAVWTLGLLIALLPKRLGLTQADSIIAPIALLVLASLCVRLKTVRDGRPVGLSVDVFVHLTFALWFLMRPDVLPGWLIVSLVLHRRRWRRLLIPLALFLLIGISWGAYKARYTKEFVLTTSSAGASLFCGLWEVPSRFALTCSDESYFHWIREHTPFNPQTQAANSFTVREVFKFWLTFPGHVAIMLDHKLTRCLDGDDCWQGSHTPLQEAVVRFVSRPQMTLSLLTIMALCVVDGYERRRTLLLGWPLFFNAPLFWVMFASQGRFYSAVPISLMVTAVPPLFEQQFYSSVARRPWRTVSVLACAGLFATAAWPFHDWLLRNDAFHYWTPLLDPVKSPLGAFK